MTRILLIMLSMWLACGQAAAAEMSAFYGKGTSSNPNADMSAYQIAWDSGALFGRQLKTVIITGEVYGEAASQFVNLGGTIGPTVVGGGARPFKFLGIGKSITARYRNTSCTLSAGAALFARTADKTQYGVAPYYDMSCGVTIKTYTMSIGRFTAREPGLSDPWTGVEYDAPVFQGIRISFDFGAITGVKR